MGKEADMIDKAIATVLEKGLRTGDIAKEGDTVVTTSQMGAAVLEEIKALA